MIYASNDPAKEISLNDNQRLDMINDGRKGYFRKTDLDILLSKTNCVGIRFYNVVKNVNSLIASAAMADGSEDNSEYLLSQGTSPAIIMSRSEAFDQANPYNSSSYMTFFSKDVLSSMIANIHSGVCIYETSFDVISASDLQQNQGDLVDLANDENEKFRNIKTHLLAAITLDAMGQIPMLTGTSGNRVSIHPCPGHCVRNNNIDLTPPDSGNNVNDPYLFDWTKVSI